MKRSLACYSSARTRSLTVQPNCANPCLNMSEAVPVVQNSREAAFISAQYKDIVAFGLLILILLFRPSGLLGKPEVEKV